MVKGSLLPARFSRLRVDLPLAVVGVQMRDVSDTHVRGRLLSPAAVLVNEAQQGSSEIFFSHPNFIEGGRLKRLRD